MSETLTSIDKMDSLNLDRSQWKLVSFGDVAIKQNESVDRETTKLKRYIAGEHMRSEDLHLREWGDVGENYLGPAFTRKFSVGDILYGSRRTYLRKVAVADFEGITANTTFVIKANEDVIIKELLPFLMLSEGFTQHSIRNSKGSVNPYINWKDIANYEFLLPPKDQQAKLAELLWAADAVVEKQLIGLQQIEKSKESLISQHLSQIGNDGVVRFRIADLAANTKNSCCGGPFGSDLTGKDYVKEPGTPVIRGGNLTKGGARFVEDGFVYVSAEKGKLLEKNSASRGDIIVTQRGTLGQVGLIPHDSKHEKYIVSQSQMKLTVDQNLVMPEFVYYYLLSKHALRLLEIVTISTGVPHINLGIFKRFPIPVPPIATQVIIVSSLNQIDATIDDAQRNLSQIKQLLKSLINQIF